MYSHLEQKYSNRAIDKQKNHTMNSAIKLTILLLLFASTGFAEDKSFAIKFSIGKGSDALSLPEVFAKPTGNVIIQQIREFRFPSKWELPNESVNAERQKYIVPVTPLEFEQVNAGWTIECKGEEIEGGLIRLTGVATYVEPELKQAVHGERSAPIYASEPKKILLTENKGESAIVRSSATHFQVFAALSKEYEFDVAKLDRSIPLRVTCNYKQ